MMRLLLAVLLQVQAQADDPVATLDGLVRGLPGYNITKEAKVVRDEEFLKRLFKDLLESTPNADQLKAFLDDPNPNKRVSKIDQVVGDSRFDEVWAHRFTEIFFGDPQSLKLILEDKPPGLEARIVKDFEHWLRGELAKNTPWTEIVSKMLTARGNLNAEPAAAYVLSFNRGKGLDIEFPEGMPRQLLGIRLYCARCHDHPTDKWRVEDFYALSAFIVRQRPRIVNGVAELTYAATGEQSLPNAYSNKGFDVKLPMGGTIGANFLFGGDASKADDRMTVLAQLMTHKQNTQLPRMLSNRVWSWLLGSSLVNPVDDYSLRNKSVSPYLQEALVRQTIALNYSLKGLVRLICATKAYQMETPSEAPDAESFRHFMARRPARGNLPFDGKGPAVPLGLEPPESWKRMRTLAGAKALYSVPGKADASAKGELGIYADKKGKYFIERSGHFDRPKISTQEVPAKMSVTLHEISGLMACLRDADRPMERTLLAAELVAPNVAFTIRFEGPTALVAEWREEFLGLLKSASAP